MTDRCPADMPLETVKSEYLAFLKERGFRPGSETVRVRSMDALCAENEKLPEQNMVGRVTAEPVYARICSPSFPCSAVDGAALDTRRIRLAADNHRMRLKPEQFTVVYTGDRIPDGCDAVIMAEDAHRNDDGSITVSTPAMPWQNIRQIGEDICAGEMILPSHTEITAASMAAMRLGGVSEVETVKRPVVGILQTGCDMELKAAVFAAMLSGWETESPILPAGRTAEEIETVIREHYDECDLFLLCMGPSPEHSRCAAEAIEKVGEIFISGLDVRPGRNTVLGAVGSKAILGITGYPAAGIILMEELVKPLVEFLGVKNLGEKRYADAVLTRSYASSPACEEFVRVRMGYVGDKLMATPLGRSSGVVTAFVKADGMLEIPRDRLRYEAGESVRVRLLKDEGALRNTLVTVGSHDPLLDELADMMHRDDSRLFMSSSHIGSMGGIMAIRRREAHVAGCHMLNTKTGEYNRSFIRKYFPDGDVKLVRLVGRQQGLMLQRGNPLNIRQFSDIAREGIRFVNRQKGSGTRILTDYLCGKNGVDTSSVYGYDREELTHTSVAAQIACGSADAGMGIFSAAKLYGLDFLPVCVEEFDLIIPDYAWNTPMVGKLLETIKSAEFREKVTEMGGYTVDDPGELIEYSL